MNEKMWILGGHEGDEGKTLNDVWSSPDGKTWTKVTASAPWGTRIAHEATAFNNKLYIFGGYLGSGDKEMWSSPDGKTWTKVSNISTLPISMCMSPKLVAADNQLWVAGYMFSNTIWNSKNGTDWQVITEKAAWSARQFHTIFPTQDGSGLYLLGGIDYQNPLSDVWYYEGATNIENISKLKSIQNNELYFTNTQKSIKISYTLKSKSSISFSIYNSRGTRITTLYDNTQPAGENTLVGKKKDYHGKKIPSGIYYI